jgi:hypothetical protein
MKVNVLLLVGFSLLPVVSARAHHSFSSEFDINQPIKLTGVLTKVDWVNPHGWIYIDVKQPDGKIVNWAIEAGGATAMLRRGLRKTDFPAGIELTVEGFRAKTGEPKANGRSVTMNDGRNFFLGPDGGQAGAPQ